MQVIIKAVSYLCFFISILVWANSVDSEPLEAYAEKCDAVVGVPVPDFNCDLGSEVPSLHFDSTTRNCDEPNRLNEECDPGSRFTVLTNSPSAIVVAHCRKRGLGPERYQDIAVIQYSRTTGATCFYQALSDPNDPNDPGLNGKEVKAPIKGAGPWVQNDARSRWYTPAQTAGIRCVMCHDNGAIIRSPYLAQLRGPNEPNALPGAIDSTFNSNQPYHFVGDDFATWKAYKVEVDGNFCITCHRLGVSNFSSRLKGTAIDFALKATGQAIQNTSDPLSPVINRLEKHKNPYSNDSPVWMPPNHVSPTPIYANAAKEIRACALRITEDPLPNAADCRITEISRFSSSPDDSRVFNPDFYLRQYPDLRAAFGNNPAATRNHWLSQGLVSEGRRGSREFNVRFYLSRYVNLGKAYGTNYRAAADHWLNQGLPKEGRRGSPEFDVEFYLKQHSDLKTAFGTNYSAAFDHWLATGLPNEGRRGSPEFDVEFYLKQHSDLKTAFGTNYSAAFDHWLNQGLPKEGRRSSPEFDVDFYLKQHADLRAAFGTNYSAAFDHWLNQGLPNEGRRGSPEFDVQFYLKQYADLRAAFGTNYAAALEHWINQGMLEGRKGAP